MNKLLSFFVAIGIMIVFTFIASSMFNSFDGKIFDYFAIAFTYLASGFLVGCVYGTSSHHNTLVAGICGSILGGLSIFLFILTLNSKKCKFCLSMVEKNAYVCKHCNYKLRKFNTVKKTPSNEIEKKAS